MVAPSRLADALAEWFRELISHLCADRESCVEESPSQADLGLRPATVMEPVPDPRHPLPSALLDPLGSVKDIKEVIVLVRPRRIALKRAEVLPNPLLLLAASKPSTLLPSCPPAIPAAMVSSRLSEPRWKGGSKGLLELAG
jgi:hypothetical protein